MIPRARQPLHTVYVSADRLNAGTAEEWGATALEALDRHGPLSEPALAAEDQRVRAKLASAPIEDLRVDFEDGYGVRLDEVEDADAIRIAPLLAGLGPDQCGVRIKSFANPTRERSLRTLDLVVGGAARAGDFPRGFRVTLAKVISAKQVRLLATACDELEARHGLDGGTIRLEIQVETPEAVMASDGRSPLPEMIASSEGRCLGLHFGTYDYTASLGVPPSEQRLDHPVADHAKSVMQVAAAAAGVDVVDGSSAVLPVGSSSDVRTAWQLHADLVTRSLRRGIYQGWDLHPAQLVTRYAAAFSFFRNGFPTAARRLQGYLQRRSGGIAEEPATARTLAAFVLRCLDAGVVSEPTAVVECGLDRWGLLALLDGETTP